MRKLFTFLGWAALVVGVLAIPAAYGIDAMFGKDVVWMAEVNAPEVREYHEKNYDERDPLITIYGEPYRWKGDARKEPEAIRTIFFGGTDDVFTSSRDPDLVMLPVTDLEGDGAPLQASSLHHIAWLAGGGCLGFALVMLVAMRLTRPETDDTATPQPDSAASASDASPATGPGG